MLFLTCSLLHFGLPYLAKGFVFPSAKIVIKLQWQNRNELLVPIRALQRYRLVRYAGTVWSAMMVPIQALRWYRYKRYDGTVSPILSNKRVKDNLRDNLKHTLNSLYMKYDKTHDQFEINDILPKLELYNYQINQWIYKNGLSVAKSYEDNGIPTKTAPYKKGEDTISTNKQSFKDAFIQYADIVAQNPHSPAILLLEQQQPLIKAAYYKLGVARVRNLRYRKKSIKAALSCLDDEKTKEQKVALLIVKLIPSGETITVANALEKMSQAYNEVGITKKPKSKDLHQWFDCSDPVSRRIDGKVKKVVDIYRSKFIFEPKHKTV